MAYFLGRDVNVYITTETGVTNKAIGATGSAASDATLVAGAPSGIVNLFADDMNSGAAIAGYTAYADITGVEVALGKPVRCESYCPVAEFCNQYQEEKLMNIEKEVGVSNG